MPARIFSFYTGKLGEKLSESNAQLARTLDFFVKFNLFAIPLYIFLIFDIQFVSLQTAVRDVVFYFLNLINFNPSVSGYLISIPIENGNWAAFISWDCTGWKSMFAFFALVMAADKSIKAKRNGLVLFLPLIFAVNILRIVFTYAFVKTYDLAYFSIVHTIVWSWGLILTVLLLWIFWLQQKPETNIYPVSKR